MRESIFSKYRNFVSLHRNSTLLPKIAEMIAYAILFEERCEISHELDPDWDSSGVLVTNPDRSSFDPIKLRKKK
jgi:hypothetical protein